MYLKLSAIGVISCRGELDVFEFEWQFVSPPVEEIGCVLKLIAISVISCGGESEVFEIDSDGCDLLSRRIACV